MNRRTSLGGAAVADRTFGYDNLDRMTAAAYTSPSVSSSWAWDALGRLVGETQSPPNKTLTYQYDLAGRRTRITWPDNLYVQYDWDFLNNLTAIRENGATSGVGVLAVYGYDSLGRRTFAGRGNGVGSSWGYDGASRLISLSHDLSGTANDLTLGYAYNPAGQIVTRTLSNPAYAYTPGAGTVSYVNNGKNQVTAVGGVGVGYDGRQNITSATTGTYGYDALNQLTTANSAGLVYDPTGRLNQISTGSIATRFLYEGQQVVGEYDPSGSMLRRYVPGFGVDDIATAYEGAGTADRRWLLADERQSVVSIANGSAVGIATNTYDEYGVPGAANAGRFQYTGQVWIPEAQLYHYRARAYAPGLGRFMQPDPAGYAAGPNLYVYVGADPINLTDPSGLGAGDCEYGILCPVDLDEITVIGSRLSFARVVRLSSPPVSISLAGLQSNNADRPQRCYQSPQNAAQLQYDAPLGNGETARQHITRRHLSGGTRSQYNRGTSFEEVQNLNVLTFVAGWQRWDRGAWVFEIPWFRIPHGAPIDVDFGTDDFGQEANRHRLVVAADCTRVISSYPFN